MCAQDFLDTLVKSGGGAIVSAVLCSTREINEATLSGRSFTDPEGYVYVIRPREWVSAAQDSAQMIKDLKAELNSKQRRRSYR